jgi:hypothetical protein
MKKVQRMFLLPVLAVGVLAAGFSATALAATGPEVLQCGGLKKAKKAKCVKENQANRLAFNQIKNSKFVGVRGDGEELEETFCANGKYESRATGAYGTGVSTGLSWKVGSAVVRRGGKWIDAIVRDESAGFEVGIQRRGSIWKIGIARFDSIEDAGVMTKTNASAICATL